jgi:L-amino acid N-acyltransferase YncA
MAVSAGAELRDARPADAWACSAIYAPYVERTAISFELEPPSAQEMGGRIATAQRAHAWLVLDEGGTVHGFAYAGEHKARAAYRWACEVSVYLEWGRRRTGAGRALYEALFDRLRRRGYYTAVAGITLPNEASIGLHRAMGFEPVGTYRRIGWKLGSWHDVEWSQKQLAEPPSPPPNPY